MFISIQMAAILNEWMSVVQNVESYIEMYGHAYLSLSYSSGEGYDREEDVMKIFKWLNQALRYPQRAPWCSFAFHLCLEPIRENQRRH
jgi:hypothetical protein